MIINKVIQSLAGAYAQQNKKNSTTIDMVSSNRTPKQDEIVLSKEARTFSTILKGIRENLNDVRAEKVASYREQIEEGTYYVPSEKIASHIIDMRY